MRDFDPHQLYAVEGHLLQRVANVAGRLYTENRLVGDEYRDLAQALHTAVDGAFELPEETDADAVPEGRGPSQTEGGPG